MAFQGYRVLLGLLVFVGLLIGNSIAVTPSHDTASLNWSSFPAGFIFGTALVAYQVSPDQFPMYLYHTRDTYILLNYQLFQKLKLIEGNKFNYLIISLTFFFTCKLKLPFNR
jgi:hypothetical protein